jgi:hypothetical protein
MEDLCTPEDETEALVIQQLLAESGITAELISWQVSAYPGLSPEWGVIRVASADLDSARKLLEGWRRARPVVEGSQADESAPPGASERSQSAAEPAAFETPPAERAEPVAPGDEGPRDRTPSFGPPLSRGWSVARSLLLVVSLLANLGLLIRYVWTPQGEGEAVGVQDEVVVTDARGRPLARYHYHPQAAFPHRTEGYLPDGSLATQSFDRDEDGWSEHVLTYFGQELVWEQLDPDEDGRFQELNGFVGDRRTVTLTDRDGDTRADETVLYDGWDPRAWLFDRDVDGFPEQVRCVDAAGVVHEHSLLSCDF